MVRFGVALAGAILFSASHAHAVPSFDFQLKNVQTGIVFTLKNGTKVLPSAKRHNIVAQVEGPARVEFSGNRTPKRTELAAPFTMFPTENPVGTAFGKPLYPGLLKVTANAYPAKGSRTLIASSSVQVTVADAVILKLRAPGRQDIELIDNISVPAITSDYSLVAELQGLDPADLMSISLQGSKLKKTVRTNKNAVYTVEGLKPGNQSFTVILRIRDPHGPSGGNRTVVFQNKTVKIKSPSGGSSTPSSGPTKPSGSTGSNGGKVPPSSGGSGAAWASSFEHGFPGNEWAGHGADMFKTNSNTRNKTKNSHWSIVGETNGVKPKSGKMYMAEIYGKAPINPKMAAEAKKVAGNEEALKKYRLQHRPYGIIVDGKKGLMSGTFATSFHVFMRQEDFELPSDQPWIHLLTLAPRLIANGHVWDVVTLCVVNGKIELGHTDWTKTKFFGGNSSPSYPWGKWVKITAYVDLSSDKIVVWVDGEKRIEGAGGKLANGNRLEGAHWGLYTAGWITKGRQYNDDIKLWPMAKWNSDAEPQPPAGL